MDSGQQVILEGCHILVNLFCSRLGGEELVKDVFGLFKLILFGVGEIALEHVESHCVGWENS
jgi:hypothetical protein